MGTFVSDYGEGCLFLFDFVDPEGNVGFVSKFKGALAMTVDADGEIVVLVEKNGKITWEGIEDCLPADSPRDYPTKPKLTSVTSSPSSESPDSNPPPTVA